MSIYTLSVVSLNSLTGKSSLCKRLIDSNHDNYQLFLLNNPKSIPQEKLFYWGSTKHRRLDEKREGIFHFIEHSSIDNELIDNYLKRISTLTFRTDEKIKNYPKDKINIDGFCCIFDLSSNKPLSEFLFLLHGLNKTRRPILIITTKNDLIDNQLDLALQFEHNIHYSLSHIPIIHTSAHEHVNIQPVLELTLYLCDEMTKKSFPIHSIPPTYLDGYKNEQSLKHIIQTEYRTLLNRHVPDFRVGIWEKFYERWQHHTSVQTFIDMFGKQQAECLYNEHIEELKRISRQKMVDEKLIPIVEMLVTDQKTKSSRNWDYVRLQMQKHPRYSSTVIPSSMWSDFERNNTNNSTCLIIPDDLLDTLEARLRFELYITNRQVEQTRRLNCRSFFDLLNRFSDAGLVHYGDSYDKDCVYFLGRECYEYLNGQDRSRVFSLHQSYLYRLLCLQFVELLFESLEIFINTFDKMNLATKTNNERNFNCRKVTTVTINDIFQKEIIQQIKHDSRYQSLSKRETDRHRLIMCHCHFLYDSIYYSSININRLLKQRKRSFKRRKSLSMSLSSNMSIDDNFCPYTRKTVSNANPNDENETIKKKFEITCPMENNCADVRIVNEILSKIKLKNLNKNILICGNEDDVNHYLQIFSNESSLINDFQINLCTLNNLKSKSIDGCLLVSSNAQEILQNSLKKFHNIPTVTVHSDDNSIPNDQLRSSLERLLSIENKSDKSIHLRILLCFMCGSDQNDINMFFSQLSARFSLVVTNQSSFMINTFLGRSNRKIEFIPVSFHSLFTVKLIDFDGFVLFHDRDRTAAINTMSYLEKHISTILQNELKEKDDDDDDDDDDEKVNGKTIIRPPVYVLSCVKDPALANIRKFSNHGPQSDYCMQCHIGTIRNFVESHLSPFLNQCWIGKYEKGHCQSEELLAGVTSYFDRNIRSPSTDLMTCSLDGTRQPLIDSINNDRIGSLTLSNDHSPNHHHSLLTPTNQEQIFTYRSSPYLSGADSTIVPTTPVDPSIPNLSHVSSSSMSTTSMPDSQHQYFQKSTSMRFAKLIEHPTDGSSYQSSGNTMNNGTSLATRRRVAEVSSEEMKFRLYKHRTAAHVKVPLATPEIIEFNETMTTPFAIQEHYDTSSPIINNTDDSHFVNSSSSSPPPTNHQYHNSTIDESITDSSKQTRATDSSVDSSSDERLQTHRESLTALNNNNQQQQQQQQNIVTLQRKPSDRKIKRVRAKQNDITGSASSSEVLKKPGSDDDILIDDDKHNEQYHQKKKRRPSFKRRKKSLYDPTQTDSGIDSRMDSKDSNKANNTPEASSNIVISNEDDSSVGDSKNASIEELEERPTANWIRRQLQYFAQARREKSELKARSPATATTTITSISSPSSLVKATISSIPGLSHQLIFPLPSLDNSYHHVPLRLTFSRCLLSQELGVPLFVEKCILFIEEHGLTIEGLYRISGYKNQVELVINKLIENPTCDLNLLQVPASAVATAFKDMMRKLDEPILSLELFDECQTLTIDQLRDQNFIPLQQALSRTNDLKYRTNRFIFKHLHFVSQHAALTHMDSSNLAVLWWPNLFQPQFRDLRTAEQICQKAKPLIQTIIDHYPIIFLDDEMK